MSVGFNTIHEVMENYKSSVYEKDIESFLSSYSSNVYVYDCWESWNYEGISQWKVAVIGWFDGLKEEGVKLKVEFNDLMIEENAELAFVHSNVSYIAFNETGDKVRQMTNRFTYGLKKENDSWRIIHEHSSLPISMENGMGIFNLK